MKSVHSDDVDVTRYVDQPVQLPHCSSEASPLPTTPPSLIISTEKALPGYTVTVTVYPYPPQGSNHSASLHAYLGYVIDV